MKHLKSKNPLIFVFVPICLLLFLTACSEEQFILSPEIDISQNANFSLAKVHNFEPSKSYSEDFDVFYEAGKTILRPRKKITLKEFIESYPYELQFDSTATKSLSNSSPNRLPPCNFRVHSYTSMSRFAPYPGKTISCFICTPGLIPNTLNSRINVSVDMRNNYGFSQIIAHYGEYSNFINTGGWNPSQIIVQLDSDPTYYSNLISTVNSLKNSSIAGFFIDEPFDADNHKCDFINYMLYRNTQIAYVHDIAIAAGQKPLFVSSFGVGGLWMYCNLLNPFHVDFTEYYHYAIISTNNTHIMCDKYDESSYDLKNRWNLFKNNWPSRNNGNFMHIDYQDPHNYSNSYAKYDALFSKAVSLGLNLICLYSEHYSNTPHEILNRFCNSAFRSYYLRGFAQTVTVYERCDLPNCIGCDNIDINTLEYPWVIYDIVENNNWFEVYP